MTCIHHALPSTPTSSPDDTKQQQQTLKQQHAPPCTSFHEQQRAYVSALVDVTVQAIASIWPAADNASGQQQRRPVANLEQFLYHILKHSRTTHSTLQLAIFYLFRIRSRVLQHRHDNVYIACGRRMFLAALICAHKFLQDKTYKNSAWSKVSGLSVAEINHAERVMLQLLDWALYVRKDTYDQWIQMLHRHLKCRSPVALATTTTTTTTTIPTPATVLHTLSIMTMSQHQPQKHDAATLPPSAEDCGNGVPSGPVPGPDHPTAAAEHGTTFKYGMPTPDQHASDDAIAPTHMTAAAVPCRMAAAASMRSPDEHPRKRKAIDDHDTIARVKRVAF